MQKKQQKIKRLNRTVEPLEYIKGYTSFLGCKIDLSKKPLIPRTETEYWVARAIKDILKYSSISGCSGCKKNKILDVFAGSGCIGIAVLKHVKNVHVTFADSEKNCIEQIKINLKLNNLKLNNLKLNTYRTIRTNGGMVVRSDIFAGLGQQEFDYIFANPPYIPTKNKNLVQKSVLENEPHQALFAGEDGLFYIKKFLKQAKNYLNKNGVIFMEFDPPQKIEIENLIKINNYKNWTFYKDQFNKYRWVRVS